jgi:hypothetical protein
MHVRTDAPGLAPGGARRLLVGGLDQLWTRPDTPAGCGSGEPAAPRASAQTAA